MVNLDDMMLFYRQFKKPSTITVTYQFGAGKHRIEDQRQKKKRPRKNRIRGTTPQEDDTITTWVEIEFLQVLAMSQLLIEGEMGEDWSFENRYVLDSWCLEDGKSGQPLSGQWASL